MKAKQEFNTGGGAVVKPFLRRSTSVFGSRKSIIVTVVILASGLAAACNKKPADASSEVAAKVGSREITLKQVDRTIRSRMDQNGMSNASFTPAQLASTRLGVLDELIRNEALYVRAEKEQGLVPDDNRVTQELQKAKQGLTEEEYKQQLQQQQITEDEVREELRKTLAINALFEREKAKVKEPKEEEIRRVYEENKAAYVTQRGADVSVIAVAPENNGGAAGAEQKIQRIYGQLRSGSDFATVAAQNSEEQETAQQGGRLGFGSEAKIQQAFPGVPNLGARLMTMSPGQYTEPIKDNLSGAFYIFLLNTKREQPQDLTYDQVKQTIIQDITNQRQQVLINSLVRVAMAEANVKNYLAERLVSNPETIAGMQPSALLAPSSAPAQPQQPQPRFENENQSAGQPPANSNRASSTNANRPARPGAATPNTNR
jgi:parvulin-like peptidyl-prolyl isomerase